MIFQVFIFTFNILVLSSKCLLSNYLDSNECLFCSYNEYVNNGLCVNKNATVLTRNILIINKNYSQSISFFDVIYNDFAQALLVESEIISAYYEGEITFFLTAGEHFSKTSEIQLEQIFFHRSKFQIKIKPLFCNDFAFETICIEAFKTTLILIDTFFFSFYVSGKLSVENIDFEILPQTGRTNSFLRAFFVVEAIFDDNKVNFPYLSIVNCSFKSSNTPLKFIIQTLFSGNIAVKNVTFGNFSLFEAFFLCDSSLLSNENLKTIEGFDEFSSNYLEKIANISIILDSLLFDDEDGINRERQNKFYFYISGFKGIFQMNNLKFSKIHNNASDQVCLFQIKNTKTTIIIENILLINITNIQLFNIEKSCALISSLLIFDFDFGNLNAVVFSSNSNLTLNKIFMQNLNFGNANTLFLLFSNGVLKINGSLFLQIDSLAKTISNSIIYLSHTKFYNIRVNTQPFLYENSKIYLQNNDFYGVFIASALFFFQVCPNVLISQTNFSNISGLVNLISGTKIAELMIYTCNFKFFANLDYFCSTGMMIDVIFIVKTNFLNFEMQSGLLQVLYPTKFFCVESNFVNHTFYTTKAYIFIFLNMGTANIFGSLFQNILFYVSGRFIFEIDSGDIFSINTTFLNNGWAYELDPAKLSNIEYNTLFYLWSDTYVYFVNCVFRNEGNVSLFSGFIETSAKAFFINIEGCSFEALNKNEKFHYHGALLRDAQYLIAKNNHFHGLECPNFTSFIHNHGILSLQGSSTYFKVSNDKITSLFNNTFIDCKCQNGGSFAIINYNKISLKEIQIKNSQSTSKAGSFFIVSSFYVISEKIFIDNTLSSYGSTTLLKNIMYFQLDTAFFQNSFGDSSGCILTQQVKILKINSLITNNTYSSSHGSVLFLQEGATVISNSFFYKSQSQYNGGAIYLSKNGNLNLDNVTGLQCSSKKGGFLYIELSISTIIYNLTLFQVSAENIGIILVNSIKNCKFNYLNIQDSEIKENGIIYLSNSEGIANFVFEHLICKNNKALLGSCIYAEASLNIIVNDVFCQNNLNVSIVFIWNFPVDVLIDRGIFLNESSQTNILYISGMNLVLSNILWENCSSSDYLLEIISSSNALLSNISLNNNNLNFSGKSYHFFIFDSSLTLNKINIDCSDVCPGFIIGENLNFILENAHIINNQAANVMSFENSNLELFNSVFSGNNGPSLIAYDSNCSLISINFLENKKNSEYVGINIILGVKYSDLNYLNASFSGCTINNREGISLIFSDFNQIYVENSFFSGISGGSGIKINNCLRIIARNSNFSNFIGNKGSAIVFEFPSKTKNSSFIIENCEFSLNSGNFGGALFILNSIHVIFLNCVFHKNEARQNNQNKYGIGGVSVIQGSKEIFINNCQFTQNFAEKFLPTIFSTNLLNITNSSFISNVGLIDNLTMYFCFPIIIRPFAINEVKSAFSQGYIPIVSGGSFNLSFELLDEFGQLILLEDIITAKLLQNSDNSNAFSIKNSNALISKIGKVNFQDISIKTLPNSTFYLEFSVELTDYDANPYKFTQNFAFYSRPCVYGEIYNKKTTECVECPQGFYSLIDPMKSNDEQICLHCNPNGLCPGGKYLIPKQGYWRMSNDTDIIVQCPYQESCLGNDFHEISEIQDIILHNISRLISENIDITHGNCLFGHEGNLCFDCIEGYGKSSFSSPCEKCEEQRQMVYLKLVSAFLFILVYLILNVKLFVESDSQIIDVVSKIYLNHIQKINIVLFFNMNEISSELDDFFSYINAASPLSENILLNDCFLQRFNIEPNFIYIFKVILIVFLPLIVSFPASFVLALWGLYKKIWKREKTNDSFCQTFFLILLISIFLFYPLVTKVGFNSFNCIYLNENEEFLYVSPNIKCWEGKHLEIFVSIGLLEIIAWGMLFPISLWLYLRNKLKRSNKYHVKKNQKIKVFEDVDQKNKSTIHFLKFFYRDYKQEYYFWETFSFLQKFMLGVVSNLNQFTNEEYSNLAFVLILLIYFYLVIRLKPFKVRQMNNLECLSLFTAIMSKILYIVHLDSKLLGNSHYQIVISAAILGLNSLFFLICIFYILKLTKWRELYYGTIKNMSKIASYINRSLDIKNKLSARPKSLSNSGKMKVEIRISSVFAKKD